MSKHANEILDLKKNPCITFGSKPHAYLRMICLLPYVNLLMANIGRFWGTILMTLKSPQKNNFEQETFSVFLLH